MGIAAGAVGRPSVRVVHVADYGSPYTGSFVPLLIRAVDAIRDEGWEAELLFGERARGCEWVSGLAQSVPTSFVPEDRKAARRRLRELFAGFDGTLVLHSHFSTFDLPCLLAAGGRPSTAVVWHAHSELSRRPEIVARNVARFAVLGRRVDRILCVAPHIVSQLVARGAPSGLVRFFPNPLDPDRFPVVTRTERDAARSRLGLPSDANVVLHFSWDWHRKGGDLLVRALAELRSRGDGNLVAVLVGAGPAARAAAERFGIEDSLRIVAPREHHSELYAAADVFVSCSRKEGMPFAVAEALSRGLGVVATDLPGHRALGTGLPSRRIVPHDPAAIAEAIRELGVRPNERVAEHASRSHAWVRANLDPARWQRRLVDVYREVLTPPTLVAQSSNRVVSRS